MASRLISDLDPRFQPIAQSFLDDCKQANIDLLVTCTLRPPWEQQALYAQGRTMPGRIVTNAKAGQSAHNYGFAIDVVPMVAGKPDWDGSHPIWDLVGKAGITRGLVWYGLPDAKFHEKPHFEFPGWESLVNGR